MNSKKPGSKPDDLIRSNTVELNEEELGSVSGGQDAFLKLDGIKGESQDHKHKDEIHIESLKPPR
jgi:type VI protein secretion system component Hcp